MKPEGRPESEAPTDRITILLIALGSDSATTRNRAHQVLVSLQKAAVAPLIGALRTSTEYGRGQAAKALADINSTCAGWPARAVIALGREGLIALLQGLIEHPASALLQQNSHHVLHDEAHDKWSRQLEPVVDALEGPDPESALPMAATTALQAIRG